jgi:hypothetical protein
LSGFFKRTLLPVSTKAAWWDRLGIGISGVCMAHCLILPILITTMPFWPLGERIHAWLHPIFAALLIPITAVAAFSGWREHRQHVILAILSVGLVIVLAAGIIGHEAPGSLLETSLTLVGSTLLITGHWRNWRSFQQCRVAAG